MLWSWLQRSHRHEPQGVRLIDDVVRLRLLAAARCGRRPTQPTSRCAGLRRTEIRSRSAVSNMAKGRELLAQKLGKALAGNHYSMLRLAAAILAPL